MIALVLATLSPAQAKEPFFRGETRLGLTTGRYDLTGVPLSLRSAGEGAPTDVAAAAETFSYQPYDAVDAHGLEFGYLWGINGIRIGAAVRKPWTTFNLHETEGDFGVLFDERRTNVRRVSLTEWRFSIGAELPYAKFTPYVDLVGELDVMKTKVTVDGVPATFRGSAFAYGLQAGCRVQLTEGLDFWAAGEKGLTGQQQWGASMGVAFAFSNESFD